jgi:2-keto-4-pentenoate hydratase/2-oxohepta-3-ene-1,7-dioic acid hydratase in catechol pathway
MRIARFSDEIGSVPRAGLVVGQEVLDLESIGEDQDTIALLELDGEARTRLEDRAGRTARRLALDAVRLHAPIARPPKFLAVGYNMPAHVAELDFDAARPELQRMAEVQRATQQGFPAPRFPTVFNKQSSCVVGPRDDIWIPRDSRLVDYEGEVAIVIGRRARRLDEAEAMASVAGYLVCNDVSVRDWQFDTPTVWLGKSFETHGPLGPWVTTVEEIEDPAMLEIRTWVNGDERQHGTLADLITPIPQIVSLMSQVCTLEPGDIIATGSPAGIGLIDGRFLRADDLVRIEVSGLGALENRVVAEPAVNGYAPSGR